MRCVVPGRYDGVLLLTVLTTAILCYVPWLIVFPHDFARHRTETVQQFAVVFGAVVAIMNLMDVYLLFGRGWLIRRIVLTFFVTAIPLFSVSISFALAVGRNGWHFNEEVFRIDLVAYAAIAQRWCMVSFLGLASYILRPLTNWRVGSLRKRESLSDNFSLAELLVLVSFAAVAFVVGKHVLQQFPDLWGGYWRRNPFFFEDEIWNHVQMMKGAAALELSTLAFFVVVPMLSTHSLARLVPGIRSWTWWIAGGWFLSSVAFVAWLSYALPPTSHWKYLVYISLAALAGYACTQIAVKVLAKHWGFQKNLNADANLQNEAVGRAASPLGLASLVLLLTGLWIGVYRYDVPTLICVNIPEHRLGISRTVARLSKVGEELPVRYRHISMFGQQDQVIWGREQENGYVHKLLALRYGSRSYFDDREELRLQVQDVVKLPSDFFRVISTAQPPFGSVSLDVNDETTLRAMLELKNVELLNVTFNHFDQELFDRFVTTTNVEDLGITLPKELEVTSEFLQSLTQCGTQLLRFDRSIRLTHESMEQVTSLPLKALACSYDSPETVDFSRLIKTSAIKIRDSAVDARVLSTLSPAVESLAIVNSESELDATVFEPLCDRKQLRIAIFDTEISGAAIRKLAQSQVASISILNEDIPIDLEAASTLAECRGKQIEIIAPNVGELFSTKFNYRFGRKILPQHFEGTELLDSIKTDGNLSDAVSRLAHEVRRDDQGSVIELNLQWYEVFDEGQVEIAELTSLRRLRIGGHALTENISQLQQLESLEIPHDWVPDSVMAHIGKLTKLRRLQLPPFPFCSFMDDNELLAPESMPFPKSPMDMESDVRYAHAIKTGVFLHDAGPAVFYGRQAHAKDHMSAAGLKHLQDLQQLEYLWIPGPLLHGDSIATIEKLPKLRELHALHTAVDPQVLKRVAGLESLEVLSVGIHALDDEMKEIFRSMQHIQVLQLFIVDMPNTEDYDPDVEGVERQFRELMPNTKIHVYVHDNLSWLTN